MSTVAEHLRAAREAKNLTVEQVAETTKIRTDHVRALEEGDYDVFSAPIYIRGSVKNYASMLKMNVPEVLTMLDAELGRTKNFSVPPPLTDQKKTIVDHLALLVAKVNWKIGFVGVLLVVAIVVGVISLLAWKHHQKSDPLKNLPPARYQPANSGDTLPLPKH
jgi:cytoskeletal protein RodZ